jgi:hypothetical protein
MNIPWASGWSDSTTQKIFDGLSAWPIDRPDEYSVCIRLVRRYHPDNIGWIVSLTDRYTQWIFHGYPADLTVPPRQYWMDCQPDRFCLQGVNIPHVFGWSDSTSRTDLAYKEWIFRMYSADPIVPPKQYWMDSGSNQWLSRQYHPDNIGWTVGVTNRYTQ